MLTAEDKHVEIRLSFIEEKSCLAFCDKNVVFLSQNTKQDLLLSRDLLLTRDFEIN